jgi:hypothetical protein
LSVGLEEQIASPTASPATRSLTTAPPQPPTNPLPSWELDLSAAERLTWLQTEGPDVRLSLPALPALNHLRVWRGATPAQLRLLSSWLRRGPQLPELRELAVGGETDGGGGGDGDGDGDHGGWADGAAAAEAAPGDVWAGASGDSGGGMSANAAGSGHGPTAAAPAAAAPAPAPASPPSSADGGGVWTAGSWQGELTGRDLARSLALAARHAPRLEILAFRAAALRLDDLQPQHFAGLDALRALHFNCGAVALPAGRRLPLAGLPGLRRVTVGRLDGACAVDLDRIAVRPGVEVSVCHQPSSSQLLRMNPCAPHAGGPWASHSGAIFPPLPPVNTARPAAAGALFPGNAAKSAEASLAAAAAAVHLPPAPSPGGAAPGYAASDAGSLDIGTPLGVTDPWFAPDPQPGQLPLNFARYATALAVPLACGCWSCLPRRLLYQLRPYHPVEVAECLAGTACCAAVVTPSFLMLCAGGVVVGGVRRIVKGARGAAAGLGRARRRAAVGAADAAAPQAGALVQ